MTSRLRLARLGVCSLLMAALVSAAVADDWPQFRGPNRDGKSSEKGLLKEWPEGGPKLLLTISGAGVGYSSATIVGDRVYISGDVDGKSVLSMFDLEGKKLKQTEIGAGHPDRQYPGTRSSVTIDTASNLAFVLGPQGDLLCADAKTLEAKWRKNLPAEFKGRRPGWRYSESVLVDGDRVYCAPGGPDATIVALNKHTGKTLWTSKGLSDGAAYSSCMKTTIDDVAQIIYLSDQALVSVSAVNGQPLWRYARPSNKTANCPSAVVEGRRVFAASGYGNGGGAVDVKITRSPVSIKAEQAWETKDMVTHHGGYVLVDGYLYGNHGNGYSCLDFKTGKVMFNAPEVGKGSIICADGMLYMMSERGGTIALAEATPEGYKEKGRFRIPQKDKGWTWAHISIANGRMYVRHGDNIFVYDIRQSQETAQAPQLQDRPQEKDSGESEGPAAERAAVEKS